MKVLIEIDETLIDKTIWLDVNNLDTEDLELMRYAIRNGVPLNGTNGEVLKAVFENVKTTQMVRKNRLKLVLAQILIFYLSR